MIDECTVKAWMLNYDESTELPIVEWISAQSDNIAR